MSELPSTAGTPPEKTGHLETHVHPHQRHGQHPKTHGIPP